MKYSFSFYLIILSVISSAQKIRFTDPGNLWFTIGFSSDNAPFQHHLSYITDTVVSGVSYKQVNDDLNNLYSCSGSFGVCTSHHGGFQLFYLIREDTVAGFVYYRNSSVFATDTAEHVLYNYNLNIGDSISYGGPADTVASIDSTLINGVYHKIFNFQNKVYGSMRSYSVLEGVGCTNNPLFPAYFGTCFEYGESLFCFSQDGYYPAIHAPVNSCAAFLSGCCSLDGSVFDNTTGCGTALLNSNLKKLPLNSIFDPNPADNSIIINSVLSFTSSSFVLIYNVIGTCIFRSSTDLQNGYSINTSSWPDGVYMVIIQDNNGILQKQKIIINH